MGWVGGRGRTGGWVVERVGGRLGAARACGCELLPTTRQPPPRPPASPAVAGCSVYVTMFPCNECAKLMIQVRVWVSGEATERTEGTGVQLPQGVGALLPPA